MEIILKKDVENLGYANDVVKVKTGYAVNYLIPQGFAVLATPSAKKQNEETIRQRAHKEAKFVGDAEALAAKLNEVSLTIAVKVSESGTTYGSVGPAQVVEALAEKGYEIDKKDVTIETIKALGTYEATIRCYKTVCATVSVEVISEAPAEAAEAVAEEAAPEAAETSAEPAAEAENIEVPAEEAVEEVAAPAPETEPETPAEATEAVEAPAEEAATEAPAEETPAEPEEPKAE